MIEALQTVGIGAVIAAWVVFVIHCNLEYWPRRWRLTPEERRREDEAERELFW